MGYAKGLKNKNRMLNSCHFSKEELISIPTKELNKILQEKGISKKIRQIIKEERRTLKNRRYAKTCRKKEERTKFDFEEENKKLKEEIKNLQKEILKKRYEQDILLDQLESISNEVNTSKKDEIGK